MCNANVIHLFSTMQNKVLYFFVKSLVLMLKKRSNVLLIKGFVYF